MSKPTMLSLYALAVGLLAMPAFADSAPPAGAHGGVPQPKQEIRHDYADLLRGNTISFRADISYPQPVVLQPGQGARSTGSELAILYLAADGSAKLKRWNAVNGVYDAVKPARWNIEADTLCLQADWPNLKADRFCMSIRVYPPVFAGHGMGVNALIKGDIRPGNPDGL
ncbi:hypothetical protein [Ferrovibrio sp.]|uniref:hypothetical protein n=1 Tax=Ferrovibrio sp. TaxID=1917215 RepID=UPI0025BD372F|nr:hypothetical protein [Ferrovibrio sp.]